MKIFLPTAVTALIVVTSTGARPAPAKHQGPEIELRGHASEEVIGSNLPDTSGKGYFHGGGDFSKGQPVGDDKKGAPIVGGTNNVIDVQNPSNLGQESTDSGSVVNIKWRFSDTKTERVAGGWNRQLTVADLPVSTDITGAQQHLTKGAIRVFHWHRVAEWGFIYSGRLALTAVDENGKNQYDELGPGDVWYFPKGSAHGVQGLDENNEFLIAFDDGKFDVPGTTFQVDDWIAHTPKDILAKNFGLNISDFEETYDKQKFSKILPGEWIATEADVPHPYGDLAQSRNSTYVMHAHEAPVVEVPGRGGTIQVFDSRNFPVATTMAASVVRIKPGGLRELHWHPTAQEWVYFAQGQARATVFTGNSAARTFDFTAGDVAVFPDNSGHYVVNTSETEELIWIEIFKADRVADISLTQWLALTPTALVAQMLNVSEHVVKRLKTEKQVIIA